MQTLRPYQVECKASVKTAFSSYDKILAVLATGLGKTTIAADLAKDTHSTLFIAHRKELIEQAYKRLVEHTGRAVGVEMASRHSKGEDIVVGSVQSLISRDLPAPELIIVDEAHHAVSATYRTVLERFPGAKVLGLTATPDRTDGRALSELFQYTAFRYETPQAIRDGWLAPIFTKKVYGVSGLIAAAENRKTVVFTPSVREAIEVAGLLPNATFVHGDIATIERETRISAFTEGQYQYIVNCNILTEGFDSPSIECVAMMRATESRALFVQCLGRGLRLSPGKSDCLFLDMVDMPAHSLEGPGNALAGRVTISAPVNSFWRRFY
jgi:superfamily II DNA or RNA helicase